MHHVFGGDGLGGDGFSFHFSGAHDDQGDGIEGGFLRDAEADVGELLSSGDAGVVEAKDAVVFRTLDPQLNLAVEALAAQGVDGEFRRAAGPGVEGRRRHAKSETG